MPDDHRFRRLESRVEGRRHPLLAAPFGAVAGGLVALGAYGWEAGYLGLTGERLPEQPTVAVACAAVGAGFGFVAGLSGLWGGGWALAFATLLASAFVGVPFGAALAAAGAPAGVGLAGTLLAGAILCHLVGRMPMPPMLQGSVGWFGILWMLFAASAQLHVLAGPGDSLALATLILGALGLAPFAVVLAALGRTGSALLPSLAYGAAGAAAGWAVLGWAPPEVPRAEGKPDVVVVVVQGLRADHLARGPMPRLAALAGGALRFTQAQSTSSWSVPAMGSMLTGVAPYRHLAGARWDGRPSERALRADVHGWPIRLRWAGYAPMAVVGDPGLQVYGVDTGFVRYDDTPPQGPLPSLLAPWVAAGADLGRFPLRLPAETVTDRALAALEGEPGGRAMLVVYADAGGPFDGVPATRSDRPPRVDAYEASLAAVDAALGRLLDGLPRNAAVVVLGDRGVRLEETRGAGHLWGQSLMPELVNVPMIVKAPGRGARTVDTPVSVVDVAPTVLALAGLEAPEGLDGVSLMGTVPRDRFLRAEATRYGVDARSARRGRYRLLQLGATEAFYDLQADPLMLEPLGQDPRLEADRREIRAALPPQASHTQAPSLAVGLGRLFARLAGA